MIAGLGPFEIILILGIALLIFGPKNLPKLGSALGKTVKSVREGMDTEVNKAEEAEKKTAEIPAESPVVEVPAATAATAAEAKSEAEPVAAEESSVFCSKCGTKNASDAAFCSKCGNKLA